MSAGRGSTATLRTPLLTPALVAVAVVAVLAVIAAGTAGGWRWEPRVWFDQEPMATNVPAPPMVQPPLLPPPVSQAGPMQRAIGAILAALVGLGVLAGLVYLFHSLWQRRPRRAVVVETQPGTTPAGALGIDADLPTLLRGAKAAETILTEVGGVPRDLVLRCWLALEEAAAASGAARKPSDSPSEFTSTVLRATQADPASVDTLLRLYHRARFSTHPVTDDDVRTARGAVVRLAQTWRGFDVAMRNTARTDP